MNNKGFTLFELFIIMLMIMAFVGEIMCVYRLFKCDFEPSYKAEAIYAISLVTGFGAITGYIDFGK
jgi:hypothetical protein